jgi:hypothetical protein
MFCGNFQLPCQLQLIQYVLLSIYHEISFVFNYNILVLMPQSFDKFHER